MFRQNQNTIQAISVPNRNPETFLPEEPKKQPFSALSPGKEPFSF